MLNRNHDALAHDLANHLRSQNSLVWEDMQMGPSGSVRPDVFRIRRSFAHPEPMSYEIKVSVSDFRSDVTSGKWEKYLEFSRAVVFAVPKGLVTKADIPQGCGLIIRGENNWRYAKKPTLGPYEFKKNVYMKLLIDGISRYHEQKNSNVRLRCDDYMAGKQALKAIGEQYGEKLSVYLKGAVEAERLLTHAQEETATIREYARQTKIAADEERKRMLLEISEALRIDVTGNNVWMISNAISQRIASLKGGDEFTALSKKIDRFEAAASDMATAMENIKNDFWIKPKDETDHRPT